MRGANKIESGRWEKKLSGGYTQAYFQSVVVYNDRIYIFGGKNIQNCNFNELYEYKFGKFLLSFSLLPFPSLPSPPFPSLPLY